MSDEGLSLLSPRLRGLLARSRLRLNNASPEGGQGDRSSRKIGSGLEFAEHRPYQPGDDLKHVDPHLEARLGELYIRQYRVDAQLPVTILIDISASMAAGEPDKLGTSKKLAAALSYLSLTGNDRVRLGALRSGQVQWTTWFTGERNINQILSWLVSLTAGGTAMIREAASRAASRLPATGLVIVLSDWQAEQAAQLPLHLGGPGREVVCVHIYAAMEANPELMGTGDLRLLDSETGEEMDVAMNPHAFEHYREAWQQFVGKLRDQLLSQQALYVPVVTDMAIEDVLLKDWTRRGLILR